MALTIEDGTIVAGANSYVTVAEADAYLDLLGNTAWAALANDAKEAALVQGLQIVDDEATYRYDGDRMQYDQPLVWPRTGATFWESGPLIPDSTITSQTKRAQIVAAGGIADGSINSGGTPGASGLVKSETVDVISVTYFSPSETGTAGNTAGSSGPYADLGWPQVTGIVAPLLDSAFYEEQAELPGGGIDPGVAARRGPSFTRPSYKNVWDVGMHDVAPGPGGNLPEGRAKGN